MFFKVHNCGYSNVSYTPAPIETRLDTECSYIMINYDSETESYPTVFPLNVCAEYYNVDSQTHVWYTYRCNTDGDGELVVCIFTLLCCFFFVSGLWFCLEMCFAQHHIKANK